MREERRRGDRWKEQIRACYFVRWVYVRAGKGRRIYVCVPACVRYVVTSGRGSKRQRGKRGPWGGGRGEERAADGGRMVVGWSVGGWDGWVRRIARVVQCG